MAKTADINTAEGAARYLTACTHRLAKCIHLLNTTYSERLERNVDAVADPRDFDLSQPMEAANAWLRYVRWRDRRRSLPKPLITGTAAATRPAQLQQARHILDVGLALLAWLRQETQRARSSAARRADAC
jgi:hypothetical protein